MKFTAELLIGFAHGYNVTLKILIFFYFYAQKPKQSFLLNYIYFSNCILSLLQRKLPFSLSSNVFVTVQPTAKIVLTLKALNKNCSRRHFNFLLLSFEENKT